MFDKEHADDAYLDDLPDIILQAQTALDDLESALADPYNWPPEMRQRAEDNVNFLAEAIDDYLTTGTLPDETDTARIISLLPDESE